jgi:hypothetical protein
MGESIKGLVKKALYWQFENYLAERGRADRLSRPCAAAVYLYQTSEEGGRGRGKTLLTCLEFHCGTFLQRRAQIL